MNKYTTISCECSSEIFSESRNYTISILGISPSIMYYNCTKCGKNYTQSEFKKMAQEQFKEFIDGKKK